MFFTKLCKFFCLRFSQSWCIFFELASASYGHKRDQRSRTDPGAVPGGSTTSASGRCASDGADPESTYVERVWLCLGMIPPLSGQEHSCQHQLRSERSAPRGLTLSRSGNRSQLLSVSTGRRGPGEPGNRIPGSTSPTLLGSVNRQR